MSQPASVALSAARTLLNDDGMQLWTDTVLIPKLQYAHRELQVQLRANACPVTRTLAVSVVNIHATFPLTPPTDMVEPITLWEREQSEADTNYVRMTESDPLPIAAQADRLVWWKWSQETLEFIGCNTMRAIRIHYKRTIPIPDDATDPLGVIDAEFYIAPRIAALAFGSTGNTAAADWCTTMANNTIADILIANKGRSRGTQRP